MAHEQTNAMTVADAAQRGNIDDLVAALASHSNLIDAHTSIGVHRLTPLHIAAMNGHVGIVERLLELGSTAINTRTLHDPRAWRPDASETFKGGNWTPMYLAAQNGHVAVIEALARLGSKPIDTPNSYGWTPVHIAARRGHVTAIEALVRLGSKAVDSRDNTRRTPLFLAASKGHVSVIEALVRLGSKAIDTRASDRWTPLCAAASNGHASVIELLVRLGSKAVDIPIKSGMIAVRLAAGSELPDRPAQMNAYYEGWNSLRTSGGHISFAEGWTPMHTAAGKGHIAVIETLLRLGSKTIDVPAKEGLTPMHAAAQNGCAETIVALFRLGSNAIDAPEKSSQYTPLHRAADSGHANVIETLVRLGSNAVDTPTKFGRTPMHIAASNGYVPVIESLVRLGSQAIDTPDNDGKTPIDHAADRVKTFKQMAAWSTRSADKVPSCVLALETLFVLGNKFNMVDGVTSTIDAFALEVRFRVYFSFSLVDRLLIELARNQDKKIQEGEGGGESTRQEKCIVF